MAWGVVGRSFKGKLIPLGARILIDVHFQPNRVEVLPRGLHDITDGLERLDKESVSRLKLVAHPQETS